MSKAAQGFSLRRTERPLHNYFERQLWTFWGTHPGEANGPLWRVNPELLEAVRPSFQDLESKLVDGSKSSYQRAKRGYAKVSQIVLRKRPFHKPQALSSEAARRKPAENAAHRARSVARQQKGHLWMETN